jgi:hypothetical protein
LAAHLRHKQVDICLPDLDIHANPNEKLEWARDKISDIIAEQALERFKIGITANPFKRWELYSEEECEWTSMILIAVDLAERCVKVMEGSLIHHFRDLKGRQRHLRGLSAQSVLMGISARSSFASASMVHIF